MLQRLQSLPRGLLSKASDATTSSVADKIFTPAKWAQQSFALNVTSAMATHIHTGFTILLNPLPQQQPNPDTDFLGLNYTVTNAPPAILLPMPVALQL